MTNSIEGIRFVQDDVRAALASSEIRRGPLTLEKAGGILDLATSLNKDLVLTSGLAIRTNSVLGNVEDSQLVAPLAVWDRLQDKCPKKWAGFMRDLEGGERRQIRVMLQAVRKSQDGIDVGTVREESALGELIKRSGINVVRQAFLYIATKKI